MIEITEDELTKEDWRTIAMGLTMVAFVLTARLFQVMVL